MPELPKALPLIGAIGQSVFTVGRDTTGTWVGRGGSECDGCCGCDCPPCMAALAARTAARRSTLLDGRDANVASMDSIAARFFEDEVDGKGELGKEADAGPEDVMEGDGGTRTIGRGTVDDDDPCGGWSSGFLRERLAAVR